MNNLPLDRPLAVEALETGTVEENLFTDLQHWRCHRDGHGVQWWLLDQQGSATNTLSQAVLDELEQLIADVEQHRDPPNGIVIRSIKANGFMAGAELREFRGLNDAEAVREPLARAHGILNRLEKLKPPTIALIHGFCLGAGLELALACRYRIARNDASLGFPEVQLGLHPGLGGTARLSHVIDPPQALTMMLTGKTTDARRAERLGLIDGRGEERHFANAVARAIAGRLHRAKRGRLKHWLMHRQPARTIIARQAEKHSRARIDEKHYPAPFALIDLWREHGGSRKQMLEAEQRSFANLLTGRQAQNLVRVFFLREALKSRGKSDANIKHVHVVGAGTMGGDIAAWCALRGLRVTLEDRAAKYIAPAMQRAQQLFARKLNDIQRRNALDRLQPDLPGNGRGLADLVIEAVPEDLDLKSKILSELEGNLKENAMLATNTSSILLEHLRGQLQDPGRFIGLHFFNPVARMQLVEVVTHDQLRDTVRERAQAFVAGIDRLPVSVKSAPGFLVNRVLTPYLLEALALIDEGVAKEEVDHAARAFGMPMGPVELADVIGLDICLDVAESLHSELDQPLYPIPDWLRRKVEAGELGRKSGHGLYRYGQDGNAKKNKISGAASESLQDRLILPMINTCVLCRNDDIVGSNDELDAAIIFATGFAPFTGGPLHYAQARGIDEIAQTLTRLSQTHAQNHGERFRPAPHWASVIGDKQSSAGRKSAAA